MRFKKDAIKPGMAIHCPQKEDVIAFLNYLKDFGFDNINWMYHNNITDDMYVYTKSLRCELDFIRRKSDLVDGTFAEISDLIEPDDISEKCFYPLQKEDPDEKIFGQWEPARGIAGNLLYYKCKGCGSHSQTPYSYCPDCGKHMCGNENEMGAEEVLDWLKKYDGKPEMLEVFGREFYNGAMDLDADEIVRRIITYEAAKKAPKPVKVEWVDVLRIYRGFLQDDGELLTTFVNDPPEPDTEKWAEEIMKEQDKKCDWPIYGVVERRCRVKRDES